LASVGRSRSPAKPGRYTVTLDNGVRTDLAVTSVAIQHPER
jgi:hypothetical protein